MEGTSRIKALACLGQVGIQTVVGVLYKASQASGGGFKYSTMSAITIAESIKCGLSLLFHYREHQQDGSRAVASVKAQLSAGAVSKIWCLSCLYAFNNQLSFFTYMLADPGTIFLFKAASTLIVALIQVAFVGKKFKNEQWRAMVLQGFGMIIVQYDPCKNGAIYTPLAYECMLLGTVITALTSVCNEYLLKNYDISMNIQNTVLYGGGVWMNLVAFFFIPNPNSKASIGFFEGYSNPVALSVVIANALIGLAISAVYKYADAVTKCIGQDITAVLLCIISSWFFGLRASLITWCGVVVVTFAVYLYMEATSKPAAAAVSASTPAAVGPEKIGAETSEKLPTTSSSPSSKVEEKVHGLFEKKNMIRLGVILPICCLGVLLIMFPDLLSLRSDETVKTKPLPSVLNILGVNEAKDCLRKVLDSAGELDENDFSQADSWRKSAAEDIAICREALTSKGSR